MYWREALWPSARSRVLGDTVAMAPTARNSRRFIFPHSVQLVGNKQLEKLTILEPSSKRRGLAVSAEELVHRRSATPGPSQSSYAHAIDTRRDPGPASIFNSHS